MPAYLQKQVEFVEDFYSPNEDEITKIADFLSSCKTIIDLGCGSGCVIRKLGERLPSSNLLGIDTRFYWDGTPPAEGNVSFEFISTEILATKTRFYDGVICAWPPENCRWLGALLDLRPHKIVWVEGREHCTGEWGEQWPVFISAGFKRVKHWKNKNSEIELWKKLEAGE